MPKEHSDPEREDRINQLRNKPDSRVQRDIDARNAPLVRKAALKRMWRDEVDSMLNSYYQSDLIRTCDMLDIDWRKQRLHTNAAFKQAIIDYLFPSIKDEVPPCDS